MCQSGSTLSPVGAVSVASAAALRRQLHPNGASIANFISVSAAAAAGLRRHLALPCAGFFFLKKKIFAVTETPNPIRPQQRQIITQQQQQQQNPEGTSPGRGTSRAERAASSSNKSSMLITNDVTVEALPLLRRGAL